MIMPASMFLSKHLSSAQLIASKRNYTVTRQSLPARLLSKLRPTSILAADNSVHFHPYEPHISPCIRRQVGLLIDTIFDPCHHQYEQHKPWTFLTYESRHVWSYGHHGSRFQGVSTIPFHHCSCCGTASVYPGYSSDLVWIQETAKLETLVDFGIF